MARAEVDRNMLFGILALHNGFISRDALIRAMSAWLADKTATLGELLVRQGDLSPELHFMMEALVQAHLKQHGDDPEESLGALSITSEVSALLDGLMGPDVRTDLGLSIRATADPTTPEDGRGVENDASAGLIGRRFRILRLHDQGGLGAVYLARDEELNREVALKQIKERFGPDLDSQKRFVAEAEITGNLEHPGVIPVYSLGRDALGRPYYAMRFIKGDSLKRAIDRFHEAERPGRDPGERTLELRKLLGRFATVCQAVAYAHSRGVIHRDLKPANVMLGNFGETLVVDWGLAKAAGREDRSSAEHPGEVTLRLAAGGGQLTMPGSPLGSPAYMSPEQAAGEWERVGAASDVYSLGATLHHLLTGRAPGVGSEARDWMERVRRGEIEPPRAIKPDVPRPLDAVCLRARALRPEDRYATPLELAGEIEHWLADEPVDAYPEPLAMRAKRWLRLHRTMVTAAAAILVLGLVSLTGITAIVASKNRELANRNQLLDRQKRLAEEQSDRAAAAELTARDEAARAKQSEEETRTVLTFFQDKVLAAARPEDQEGGLGIDATIRKAVDAAEPDIEKAFSDQPAVEASIREALGATHRLLGESPAAIRQLERSRDLRRRLLGAEDPLTLSSARGLATAYLDAGRTAEALALCETTLKLSESKLGPDHPDTLASRNNLAAVYYVAGRTAEALVLHESTLKRFESKFGPDHPDTLTSRNNLASAYYDAGRTAEAIALYESTLKAFELKLGPDHPDTLTSRANLASVYNDAGRTAEAIALYESTLKLRESKLGPDHPDTLTSRTNLAAAYYAAGRTAEALALFETTLKLRESKLGPDHPDTISSRNNLAVVYQVAGRTAEALALFETTLKLRESKLGPDHPDTIVSRNNLALAYRGVGRTAEALAMFETTLKLRESKLGLDHPDTLKSRNNLALAYNDVGRIAEALALDETTLRLRELKLGPDHPDTLVSRNNLAAAYENAGRAAEAIANYETTLKLRESKLGPDHPDTLVSRNNLAAAYGNAGRAAEAVRLWESALSSAQRVFGGGHPRTMGIAEGLATAYGDLGRWSEAERLLREMLERSRSTKPINDLALAGVLARLGVNLLKQSKWSEAEPMLRECLTIREKAKPDAWTRYNVLSLLGDAVLGQRRFAEAEPLLVGGYQGLKARKAAIPAPARVRLPEAAARVVRLYEQWGKVDQASRWRVKLGLADLPRDVFAGP